MQSIGLIAGNGDFPILFARAASANGMRVVAVGMRGETNPEIANEVDNLRWVSVGQLGGMIRYLRKQGIRQAAMAGGVRKTRLFDLWRHARPDLTAARVLMRNAIRPDDGLLRAVAAEFERNEIEIVDSALYMPQALAPSGPMTSRTPSRKMQNDIDYARDIARAVGRLDVGQTVVVKDGAVVAIEAIEGTDECIMRAGKLTGGGRGAVVMKVAKPGQDMRFDLPTVGVDTIATMAAAGIDVLGVEAGRTLMLKPEDVIQAANHHKMVIVGVE